MEEANFKKIEEPHVLSLPKEDEGNQAKNRSVQFEEQSLGKSQS